ncbi:hypothetical protein [Ottowia sp. VDI28]|uniref:hypothetical protein n=1 Tax=Ottowia sp. VDI28 TaxID=3133968 RepID=UPI003C2ED1BF
MPVAKLIATVNQMLPPSPNNIGFIGGIRTRPHDDVGVRPYIKRGTSVMSLDPAVINGLFALGGVLAGAIPAVVAACFKERSESRRHLRDQALKVALEAWRVRLERQMAVQPLEHQVIYSTLLAQLASENRLTPDRVKARLNDISAIVDVMAKHSASKVARS